ncbi:MAG TPA: hypothetical protein VHP11_07490 [Tepidisphaeraceae bacterium]|nr:hypothetical protein [Tepidisphaeraceae bacterium]
MSNHAMNDAIRAASGRGPKFRDDEGAGKPETTAPPQDQAEPSAPPPGHAGAGTGTPPRSMVGENAVMNILIRKAAGRRDLWS